MGLLNFFLGDKKISQPTCSTPTCASSKPDVSFDGKTIEINSIDFVGQASKSESGEWIICWGDYDIKKLDQDFLIRVGHRENGYGSYILYNTVQNRTVLKGQAERPNSGSVANNGYFSLEDWGFSGSGLSAVFYVYSPSGEIIIKRSFEANIFNSAISVEGKLAVCQTCHNPSGSDGNLLTLFDLINKTELFSIHPIEQWAEKYKFLEDQQILIVTLKDIGEFRYDKFGKFLDYATYNSARLTCKDYGVILRAAYEFLKKPDLDQKRLETILDAILRARLLGADADQGNKLFALKIQGFALEALCRHKDALAVYEEALAINPKIGVKRKADALKKKLGRRAS